MKNKKVSEIIDTKQYIDDGFEDIVNLSRRCRFSDCTYTTEADCAVIESVSNGSLLEERVFMYLKQKHEAEYVYKRKNKTKAIDYMKQKKLFSRNELT